ncbi:Rrf2 family transcriptional regulator [Paenibacillus cisolokensis]|jgi:Rrf2 family protein|uniref:Transcriptional regulator n=1 Tax=Paenibacillus cisolokensis TaxID=1658519 RepID=A0ABQ4NBC0_9BACL|nr:MULTISPECIES: Rrf2 family transcriptional regulator [Paenibacillus]ALS25964.1 Rrf2 family transcriptional regulator [Paenibacillus sp. 32O-W]GIQ65176.1 transcriptional regulator [Paenibacillus cisolokensis]
MNSEFTIAVHSLVLLAYLPERMATSETIAVNVGTHPARVRKVMSCLRRGGYVDTREGSGGGYWLTAQPAEVTLKDIYRVIAIGSLMPNWCSGNPDADCIVGSNMKEVMYGIFCAAEQRLESYFAGITIADVLAQIRECEPK